MIYQKESSADGAVLIVTSSGADPSQDLEETAARTVGLQRLHQVSMGQGQQQVAIDKLKAAAEQGDWLCLKNLHLALSWLPQLQKVE